jgi:uroporphyrinogen-III synthase
VTAATARAHGLTVDVEAEVHTIDGLVDALVAWAAEHPAPP